MIPASPPPLVSVALPVYNGAESLASVIESVLAQTHTRLELVISDNASTDDTGEICRHFAREDSRVSYRRHEHNVGVLNNFRGAAARATGDFVRWIGDDDLLAPEYVARVLETFAEDERRALVTTQIVYTDRENRETLDTSYQPGDLASDDPVVRFGRMLRLLTTGYATIDPIYGVIRRDLVTLPRRNMLREDQVFVARLALEGPWGHVPEPLARRTRDEGTASGYARLLGVPAWRRHVRVLLQCRELAHWVGRSSLDPAQQRRARAEIVRFYGRSKSATARRAIAKVQRVAGTWPGQQAAKLSP